MTEKQIEENLRTKVKKRGGLCEKWTSGTSGWPDRIILFKDSPAAFIEVKAPGKVPRPLQVHRHKQLRSLGFKVFVLDNEEDIGGILDDIQTT